MGNELCPVDEKSLIDFSEYVIKHFDYKKDL